PARWPNNSVGQSGCTAASGWSLDSAPLLSVLTTPTSMSLTGINKLFFLFGSSAVLDSLSTESLISLSVAESVWLRAPGMTTGRSCTAYRAYPAMLGPNGNASAASTNTPVVNNPATTPIAAAPILSTI